MNFKESLDFYIKYLKPTLTNRLSICRIDNLLRNQILKSNHIKNNIQSLNERIVIKFKFYVVHCLLAFYSIFNILKVRVKGIKVAHYLIDINNNDTFYDSRSQFIFDIVSPKESANFMHINNIKYTLKTLLKKDNIIYFESIYFMLKPFFKKQRYQYKKTNIEKVNQILEINQNYYNDSYYIQKITKIILKFLQIKKFIMLDDTRYTNELKLACSDLKIKTIGYMHARFNKYHLGIFEFPFDTYIVWNEYFKNILLSHENYKNKAIIIIGNPKLDKKIDFVKRGKNILWLGESNVNYSEIFHYIKKIKELGYKVIFRGKPGKNATIDSFLEENNIKKDSSKNYFESLKINQVGLVIATYSTTLMESWLYGVPSFALKCSYDYGSHLWEDGLVELCEDAENIAKMIDNCLNMNQEIIKQKKLEIWGDKFWYDKEKCKNIVREG